MEEFKDSKETNKDIKQVEPIKKRKGKWYLAIFPGVLLMILFVLFVLVITTSFGQKKIIETIDYFREDLQITSISGSLQNTMILDGVSFRNEEFNFKAEQLSIKLNLKCLLKVTLCIDDFKINQSEFHQKILSHNEDNKKEDIQTPLDIAKIMRNININLPIDAHINNFQVNDFRFVNNQNVIADKVNLSLQETVVKDNTVVTKLDLNGSFTEIDTTLTGNIFLDFNNNLLVNGKLVFSTLENKKYQLPSTNFDILVEGALKEKTVINITNNDFGDFSINATTDLDRKDIINANIKAQQLNLDNFVKELAIPSLSLNIKSDFNSFSVKGNNNINIQGLSLNVNNFSAQGDSKKIIIDNLVLKSDEINTKLQGSFKYDKDIQWDITSDIKQIDLQKKIKNIPLNAKGIIISKGFFDRENKKFSVNFDKLYLKGMLGKKPLLFDVISTSNNKMWLKTEKAFLKIGNNEVTFDGELGKKSQFSAHIKAPNLKEIYPSLKGNIIGDVIVQGDVLKPKFDLNLIANDLRFNDFYVKRFSAKGNSQIIPKLTGNLVFLANDIKMKDSVLKQAKLRVDGAIDDHNINLNVQGSPVNINTAIKGSLSDDVSSWNAIVMKTKIAGKIDLEQLENIKAQVNFGDKRALLSPHCWKNKDFNLCFDKEIIIGKSGGVHFKAKNFNTQFLSKYLPLDTSFKGLLAGDGYVVWSEDKPLQADIKITSQDLLLHQKLGHRQLKMFFKPISFKASLQNNDLHLIGDADIKQGGNIFFDVKVNDLVKKRIISGDLNLQKISLNMLKSYLLPNEDLAGELDGRLKLSGNLKDPIIIGNVGLSRLRSNIELLPLQVKNGIVDLKFLGSKAVISGNLKTFSGNLSVTGAANWEDSENWYSYLDVKGKSLKGALSWVGDFTVDSDLSLKLNPNKLDLTGNIDILQANLTFKDLSTGAIDVSEDEVIIDDELNIEPQISENKNNESNFEILANIDINAPKSKVRIEGFGVKGFVFGNLKIKQSKEGFGLYGKAQVQDAIYLAYGQNLKIRKGSATFTGFASRPELNIEAVREINDNGKNITTGITLIGNLKNPKITVFSQPSLSQTEALSYLISGQGFDNNLEELDENQEDNINKVLGKTATSASSILFANLIQEGLKRVSKPLQKVDNLLGFSNLNANIEGGTNNLNVAVSADFLKRFNVKYKRGLYKNFNEISVGVQLYRSLYLRWLYNVSHSLDLMYQVEFD